MMLPPGEYRIGSPPIIYSYDMWMKIHDDEKTRLVLSGKRILLIHHGNLDGETQKCPEKT